MRRQFLIGAAAGFMLFFVGLTASAQASKTAPVKGSPQAWAKTVNNPVPPTADSIAAGRRTFAKECSPCHGFQGKGDGTKAPEGSHPANLVAGHWSHGSSDGEIFVTILEGVGPQFDMASWKDKLSDQEIWN